MKLPWVLVFAFIGIVFCRRYKKSLNINVDVKGDDEIDDVLNKINPDVSPCDDFYTYACGGAGGEPKLQTEMQALGATARGSFSIVAENVNKAVEGILAGEGGGTHFALVRGVYSSCMDLAEDGSNDVAATVQVLQGWMDTEIRWDIKNKATWTPYESEQFSRRLAKMSMYGVEVFASATTMPDILNPTINIGAAGDVGLPKVFGLDFPPHLWATGVVGNVRQYYSTLLQQFVALGYPVEDRGLDIAEAIDVLAQIGQSLRPELMASIDIAAVPRVTRCADLSKTLHSDPLDWPSYCNELGVDEDSTAPILAIHASNSSAQALFRLGPAGAMRVMETLMLMEAAEFVGGTITKTFRQYAAALSGREQVEPWSDVCLQIPLKDFPWILSKQFVQAHFPPEANSTSSEMMASIQAAFLKSLEEIDWMDPQTKGEAKRKAEAMGLEVGIPSWILDQELMDSRFDNLHLNDGGAFIVNALEIRRWKAAEKLGEWGKPMDAGKWLKSPLSVSQYYNLLANRIVFTAGSMQPPNFKSDRLLATNYGGIGMIMGHELTHAFDSNGAKRNANGALENWWGAETLEKFEERQGCFKEQYGNMKVRLTDTHVDGSLTLGENIADNGGLALAWRAFQAAKHKNLSGANEMISSKSQGTLSADKLFFVGFAQLWCTAITPAALEHALKTDSHAPASVRVQGVLQNSPAFARTFSCPVGSAMNPGDEERCSIWGGPAWKVSEPYPIQPGLNPLEEALEAAQEEDDIVHVPI